MNPIRVRSVVVTTEKTEENTSFYLSKCTTEILEGVFTDNI